MSNQARFLAATDFRRPFSVEANRPRSATLTAFEIKGRSNRPPTRDSTAQNWDVGDRTGWNDPFISTT